MNRGADILGCGLEELFSSSFNQAIGNCPHPQAGNPALHEVHGPGARALALTTSASNATVSFSVKAVKVINCRLVRRSKKALLGLIGSKVLLGALAVSGSLGATAAVPVDSSLFQTNFPFQGACISAKFPAGNTAMKGLAIRVGHGASVLFDTDLLRLAAGWTGGYITSSGVAFNGGHGGHPSIVGEQKWGAPFVPGWAGVRDAFKDPRPEPFGPLPKDWAHWDGIYVNGMDVVLAYTVRGTKIHEQPSSVEKDGQIGFVRTFQIEKPREDLTLLVCEANGSVRVEGTTVTITNDDLMTKIALVGLKTGAEFKADQGRIVLRLPNTLPASTFKVVLWGGLASAGGKFSAMLAGEPRLIDFKKGGPAHFPEAVITRGELNTSQTPDGAYATDSLTPPQENPWKRRVRFSGVDFFKDGKRAALSTWDGDIWIVSGIDEGLQKLTWKRFASGMYETLGLTIIDDVIYTSGRDQITRYRDLNGDGEADFYENFNNDYTSSEGFHEFVFDLQHDAAGNFYFAKAGPVRPGGHGFERISANAGTLMKVSKDGQTLSVVATGFRAPNGIGVSPTGQLTTCDNEGTWVPACPINWIKPGGFYGVEDTAHAKPIPPYDKPLCWLSHNGWDNSGGGQTWVTTDKWGPFQGEMLHTSYGQSALYLVCKQRIGEEMQGGVVRIPVKFTSSAMRPKFNPGNGQLYVAGLRGWQTTAAKLTGLDRVRYTGKPVYSIKDLQVDRAGVHLTFTQPLDPKDAADPQNYAIERWNYERAEHYGSAEFSVSDPKKRGHDKLEITGAQVSADGKTVTLQVADLKPAMQMQIKYIIKAKDGAEIDQAVQHTVHVVPEATGGIARK